MLSNNYQEALTNVFSQEVLDNINQPVKHFDEITKIPYFSKDRVKELQNSLKE